MALKITTKSFKHNIIQSHFATATWEINHPIQKPSWRILLYTVSYACWILWYSVTTRYLKFFIVWKYTYTGISTRPWGTWRQGVLKSTMHLKGLMQLSPTLPRHSTPPFPWFPSCCNILHVWTLKIVTVEPKAVVQRAALRCAKVGLFPLRSPPPCHLAILVSFKVICHAVHRLLFTKDKFNTPLGYSLKWLHNAHYFGS